MDSKYTGSQSITHDWRWLSVQCERKLIEATNTTKLRRIKKFLQRTDETQEVSYDVAKFSCFAPRTILEAIADKRIHHSDDFDIKIEEFDAAVMFCDASGFTALTSALDLEPNGVERLGKCINDFFDPLIKIVNSWGGDIIKFSGDALTVVWPVDDEALNIKSTGEIEEKSDNLIEEPLEEANFIIDSEIACKLAINCCLELQEKLHRFSTPIKGKVLSLHSGIGFGKVTILQVGGIMDRWEYVVAGVPFEEIAIAEPLASEGETVISYSVYSKVLDYVSAEQIPTELLPQSKSESASFAVSDLKNSFYKLHSCFKRRIKHPPPLAPIQILENDIDLLKRYIPPSAFKRLIFGYSEFLNEIRKVSICFIGVRGLNVSTSRGCLIAHSLMKIIQKSAYTMEGSVNKFLVDDKGVLLLVMFGLPPVCHLDDPIRAVMCCLRVMDGMKSLNLSAGIGISTGRVWCGTLGNEIRKEYTALGDFVNISARLMSHASSRQILVDRQTYEESKFGISYAIKTPIKVKGKINEIEIFSPLSVLSGQLTNDSYDIEAPLLKWPEWKYRKEIEKMFSTEPCIKIADIKLFSKPPLDYPVTHGPLFPHEWFEPLLPELQPKIMQGGLLVIKGTESMGTIELEKLISHISTRNLKRKCFNISNMPEASHINIGNIPLLAWQRLCTEIVKQWKISKFRKVKDYSLVGQDNSKYELAKELLHPCFHWQIKKFKHLIHGFKLPWESVESYKDVENFEKTGEGNWFSQPFNSILKRKQKNKKKQSALLDNNNSANSNLWDSLKVLGEYFANNTGLYSSDLLVEKPFNIEVKNKDKKYFNALNSNLEMEELDLNTLFTVYENHSVATLIGSLVNGFTSYESSVIILHVRSGTSVFAEMDKESWKVAQLIAQVAILRKKIRMQSEVLSVKNWRRKHSRSCLWCKGYCGKVTNIAGEIQMAKETPLCEFQQTDSLPPFLFILICSDSTDKVPEQQSIIKLARESGSIIDIERLNEQELKNFLSCSLNLDPNSITDALLKYVNDISAGDPKFAYLTMQMLLEKEYVTVEQLKNETKAKSSTELPENFDDTGESSDCSISTLRPDKLLELELKKQEAKAIQTILTEGKLPENFFPPEKDMPWNEKSCYGYLQPVHIPPLTRIKRQTEFNRGGLSPFYHSNLRRDLQQYSSVPDRHLAFRYRRTELTVYDQSSALNNPYKLEKICRLINKAKEKEIRRLRHGFLTTAEKEFLRNPPRWYSMEIFDQECMEACIKREQNKLEESEQDSDASFIMTNAEHILKSKKEGLRYLSVNNPLTGLPLVPALSAYCMFIIERLEPDEQLLAKMASLFPGSFSISSLYSLYRQDENKSLSRFLELLAALLEKRVFCYVQTEMAKASSMPEAILNKWEEQQGTHVNIEAGAQSRAELLNDEGENTLPGNDGYEIPGHCELRRRSGTCQKIDSHLSCFKFYGKGLRKVVFDNLLTAERSIINHK